MLGTMQQVLTEVLARLRLQITTFIPSLLAALIILLGAYVLATAVRLILKKLIKGARLDGFLRRSGIVFVIDASGRLRTTRLVAETAYWLILTAGFLAGLSVFDTDLTSQMIQNFMLLLPKLVLVGLILLASFWLGHFLGRSALIWAVNESVPYPRRIACAVRTTVMFAATVASAYYLDFAGGVFLAAFIILLGGAVLAASLALGLGGRDAVRRLLENRTGRSTESGRRSLWSHL